MATERQAAAPSPGAPAEADLRDLQGRLGHEFAEPALLRLALTHRSWCAEHASDGSNERLEFLGDAVLGLVVTEHLYRSYPGLPEGELAKTRAWVVSAASLAEVAAQLGLGEVVLLGKGEHQSGGRRKPSILADALEAVLGAVHLDGGLEPARRLVLDLLGDRIDEAAEGPGGNDHKTRLQELGARRWEALPDYEVRDEGPDHDKRFFATVRLGGEAWGHGEGRSKKQAEQAAARAAWERLVTELGTELDDGSRATTTADRSPHA